MKERITKSQFTFIPHGYGSYQVIYQSAYDSRIGRYWLRTVTDMELIDATKNTEDPNTADLLALRREVKRGCSVSKH